MKLQELFSSLALGELSNLAMAENGNGSLTTASRPRIVACANEALIRLYSRFVLRERELILEMQENITLYWLKTQHALSYVPQSVNEGTFPKYIIDSQAEPYQGDLLKILSVVDDLGSKVPLNDSSHPESVFTPQYNLVQIPVPIPERRLSVIYQAKHIPLTGNLTQEIELPYVLFGALSAYIAYKVFSYMNTADGSAKSLEYAALYEKICAEAVDRDLVNTSMSTTNTRFNQAGWV
jgi:hypothetical protein